MTVIVETMYIKHFQTELPVFAELIKTSRFVSQLKTVCRIKRWQFQDTTMVQIGQALRQLMS